MLVSVGQLAEWLSTYQGGSRIVSATMLTPLKMNKTHRVTKEPNPYLVGGESSIDHLSERVVVCGADYGGMVNRVWATLQGEVIPTFEVEALWKGAGIHLNRYVAQHVGKGTLYLCLYYATIRGDHEWVDRSLTQEAWLDRFTGQLITPDWEELAPYLPPAPLASRKQGCQEGADLTLDVGDETYTIEGGSVGKEIKCRYPHLENLVTLRSWDLRKRGHFEVVQVNRRRGQVSV